LSLRIRHRPLPALFIYGGIAAFALACLVPFLLMVMGSVTNEEEIVRNGYVLVPHAFADTAWKMLFRDIGRILSGYKVTFIVAGVGTILSLGLTALTAYPLAVPTLKYRNVLAFIAFFTLIFSGGIVPWYIVVTRILGLRNSYLALIIPYLVNAWNLFLLRNFFRTIPTEIAESARIDGAPELMIFTRLILPLSKAGLATVGLFIALMYWNDWWLGLMLVEDQALFPLQLLLRAIVSNVQFLRSTSSTLFMGDVKDLLPYESVKMATGLITIGPIILLYPFVQKYFVKGIIVGALKG
jgi:putative aldouronate transport system permease protein